MAFTKNSLVQSGDRFCVNFSSDDVSGNEELVAAAGAGKAIYLEQVVVNCVAAISITIQAGTAALLGPMAFTATSGSPHVVRFHEPVKLTDNTALNIDGDAGVVQGLVEGFTR